MPFGTDHVEPVPRGRRLSSTNCSLRPQTKLVTSLGAGQTCAHAGIYKLDASKNGVPQSANRDESVLFDYHMRLRV